VTAKKGKNWWRYSFQRGADGPRLNLDVGGELVLYGSGAFLSQKPGWALCWIESGAGSGWCVCVCVCVWCADRGIQVIFRAYPSLSHFLAFFAWIVVNPVG
jgi:hypothetical protein